MSAAGASAHGLTTCERAGDRLHHRARDRDVGAALVLAVHEHPRREVEVGVLEQTVVHRVGAIVILRARELAVGHAPARRWVVVKSLEAAALRLLRYVKEELHHRVAVIGKLALEAVNRLEVAARLLARGRPLARRVRKHVLKRRRVPAAVEERDGATLAERAPEWLHEREVTRYAVRPPHEAGRLAHVGLARHEHRGRAGVELVHEVGDAAALAGAVPPLEEHRESRALAARALLQHHELAHEVVVLALVRLLGQRLLIEVDTIEHHAPLPPRGERVRSS